MPRQRICRILAQRRRVLDNAGSKGVNRGNDHRSTLRELATDPRLILMLALGFSSGLPFLLVFGTLSAWLREAGISRTEIGLLSWVALAYSFKFVWSPVVDRVDLPVLARLLGRRRAWMLAAQATIAVGLIAVALSDPATRLYATVAGALLVAFASATQDVVIDAWRIDVAPTSRQGMMAALYQLGYRLALIAAGAGALYIADFVDWRTAYIAMAGLTAIGMIATFLSPPGPSTPAQSTSGGSGPADGRATFSFIEAVVEPFLDLLRRKGLLLLPILALVALYRLPDFVAGVMANPLYIDLGFSLSQIASVSKIYGVWIGILGAFVGGVAVTRIGLMPSVLVGGIIAAGSNVMFAWLALSGARLELLTLAISIDNFSGGFAGTALIAYMSGLTVPMLAATQYALLSSLYALPGKFVGGASGLMVDTFGYPTFFTLTASIGLPVVALSALVWWLDPGATADDVETTPTEAVAAKPAP